MEKHYAIPSKQKYPIETAEHVKVASEYFDEYYKRMDTNDRAEFASSVRSRADELGVKVASDNIINYSNRGFYSPEFEQNMLLRKIACATQGVTFKAKDGTDINAAEFVEKLASAASKVKPEEMVYFVHEFDKTAGLISSYDHSIKDAYFTVFGCNTDPNYIEKVAADKGHWLADSEVKVFADLPGAKDKVMTYFGENFAQDFISQPVATYKSLTGHSEREAFYHMIKGSKK